MIINHVWRRMGFDQIPCQIRDNECYKAYDWNLEECYMGGEGTVPNVVKLVFEGGVEHKWERCQGTWIIVKGNQYAH